MSPARTLALMLDPALILTAQGLAPDPWQRDLLLSTDNSVLLCCSRQAGKSTTVSALAVHTALLRVPALTLILWPSQRQSGETFRKIKDAYNALGRPAGAVVENQSTLELAKGSRVVCLPGAQCLHGAETVPTLRRNCGFRCLGVRFRLRTCARRARRSWRSASLSTSWRSGRATARRQHWPTTRKSRKSTPRKRCRIRCSK